MKTNARQQRREHARQHINPKLRRNLRLFFAVALALLIVVVVETIRNDAVIWQVLLGLGGGILFGIFFARMYKLSWDSDAQHVSSNIDLYGVAVLILYIVFDLSRGSIVHVFTHNASVSAISWALLAGAMYGRVLGSGHVIVGILHDQKVFSRQHARH